jgi:hypothetical protein
MASRIYFTISVPHKGSHKPQLTLRTTNEHGYQLGGFNFGSSAVGGDATKKYMSDKDRFEFNFNISRSNTRISLVVNTVSVPSSVEIHRLRG